MALLNRPLSIGGESASTGESPPSADAPTRAPPPSRIAPMHTGITGATGLIGRAVAGELLARGQMTTGFTRGDGRGLPAGARTVRWNPLAETGEADPAFDEAVAGLDAIVHLAGEPVGKRWTPARKRAIRASRVRGTGRVVSAIARAASPPKRLLCASAIGYYGPRGDEELAEDAAPGNDFLAGVAKEWEAAAAEARNSGVEVASLRIGVVLSADGGALGAMLPPFRLGVGGRLGGGRQWMPWIHIADIAGAIVHLLEAPAGSLAPVYNLTAPNPATNAEFTRALGRVLHRPAVLPAPGFAVRLALGEMADALLLSGQRVVPRQLRKEGFRFTHPELEPALRHLLG